MHRGFLGLAVISLGWMLGCPAGGDDQGASSADTSATSSTSSSATGPSSASATSTTSASSGAGTADGSGSVSMTSSPADTGTTTAGGCDPPTNENPDYICCDGTWVDPRSDQFHCGDCETTCEGATPFCDQGTCAAVPCDMQPCNGDQTCCGSLCCDAGMICCTINGPVESGPGCVPPTDAGSCPGGCAPLCACNAPETPIATPTGDRAISTLAPGDLVYSIDHGATVVVPIARVQRIPVHDHRVVEVLLDDGRRLRVTPSHPLADGRAFGDLRVGQGFGDVVVTDARIVPYDEPFTHDILPQSSSGAYFVAGELVASTMAVPLGGSPR